jgi:hypothetical protein
MMPFGIRRVVVAKNSNSTQSSNVIEILRQGRRDDIVIGGDGKLDGIAPDACGATPDENGLPVWLSRTTRRRQWTGRAAGHTRSRKTQGMELGMGAVIFALITVYS